MAFGASLIGAVWVLNMAILAVDNNILFFLEFISGLIILVCSAALYKNPHLHAAIGATILAVALVALFTSYFFLFPAPLEFLPFAMMFVIGPVIAGAGGFLGLSWQPTRFPIQQVGH